jgi:3-oxoadipate enol-lactonase
MPRFRRQSPAPDWAPEPPVDLPPGRLVHVRGVGELFVRDSGRAAASGRPDRPAVLLLHGWMFASDLNWWPVYDALISRGYRVVAVDHRGHGRGLRTPKPFTLADCAHDAARVVEALGCGPVTAVGYSMGGPIAQLLARDHPEAVRALVLCATSRDWQDPYLKLFWRSMALLRLMLGLFPTGAWNTLLRAAGLPPSPQRSWVAAELSRGSARDIAEAGRELGRFDARPWLREITQPAAVVVTTKDRAVPPRWQRALAAGLSAPAFDSPGDHFAAGEEPEGFNAALLRALAHVAAAQPARAAA